MTEDRIMFLGGDISNDLIIVNIKGQLIKRIEGQDHLNFCVSKDGEEIHLYLERLSLLKTYADFHDIIGLNFLKMVNV